MSRVSRIFRDVEGGGLAFFCPGCQQAHRVWVGEGPPPRWGWNNDLEKPVFTPSILVTWSEPTNLHDHEAMQRDLAEAQRRRDAGETDVRVPVSNRVCHSFVGCNGAEPGQITFLGDCTHALAGRTVDMCGWPKDEDFL